LLINKMARTHRVASSTNNTSSATSRKALATPNSTKSMKLAKTSVAATNKRKRAQQEDDDDEDNDEEEDLTSTKKKKNTTSAKKAPAPKSPVKKKAKTVKQKKSPVKNAKTAAPLATSRMDGQLDSEYAGKTAKVVKDQKGNRPYDAFLCFVEGTSDKYYVLQLIEDNKKFFCFSRWGRTGAKGQMQTDGPHLTLNLALQIFEKKFEEKTKNTWSDFTKGKFKHVSGSYDCLSSPIAAGVATARKLGVNWEYEVTDNVAGKRNGWYSYDVSNADEVEAIYQAWKLNPTASTNLSQRVISSGNVFFIAHN